MRQGRNLLLALAMTGAAGVCSLPAQTAPAPTPAAAEVPASAPAETPTPGPDAAVPPASVAGSRADNSQHASAVSDTRSDGSSSAAPGGYARDLHLAPGEREPVRSRCGGTGRSAAQARIPAEHRHRCPLRGGARGSGGQGGAVQDRPRSDPLSGGGFPAVFRSALVVRSRGQGGTARRDMGERCVWTSRSKSGRRGTDGDDADHAGDAADGAVRVGRRQGLVRQLQGRGSHRRDGAARAGGHDGEPQEDKVACRFLQGPLLLPPLGQGQRRRPDRESRPDAGQRPRPDCLYAEDRAGLGPAARARQGAAGRFVERVDRVGRRELLDRDQTDQQPAQDLRRAVPSAVALGSDGALL